MLIARNLCCTLYNGARGTETQAFAAERPGLSVKMSCSIYCGGNPAQPPRQDTTLSDHYPHIVYDHDGDVVMRDVGSYFCSEKEHSQGMVYIGSERPLSR